MVPGHTDKFGLFRDFIAACSSETGANLVQIHRRLPLKWERFRALTRELESLGLIETDALPQGRMGVYSIYRSGNFRATSKGQDFLKAYTELERLASPLARTNPILV